MEKIVKEVQRIEEVITYKSIDGKEFSSHEDCMKWEKSYECTIRASLKNIPHIKTDSESVFLVVPPEEDVLILKPRNMEDIEVINAYGRIIDPCSRRYLTQDDIGKKIMIETGFDEDCFYIYRMDEYLQGIIDSYKALEKQLEEVEGNKNA